MRVVLWLFADLPLDFDRHKRLAWAHGVVATGHAWVHAYFGLQFRKEAPLARYVAASTRRCCDDDDVDAAKYRDVVMALVLVKMGVFGGFWLAHVRATMFDRDRGDHVTVAPVDGGSLEVRALLPSRRRGNVV